MSNPDNQPEPSGSVYVITAFNVAGDCKECVVVTSEPLANTIYKALKGIWIGGFVALVSRQVDEVPANIIAEIDVMENPPKTTGWIGGGRHG
jgi:hypothetical protein